MGKYDSVFSDFVKKRGGKKDLFLNWLANASNCSQTKNNLQIWDNYFALF